MPTACFIELMLSDQLPYAVSPSNSPSQDPDQWLYYWIHQLQLRWYKVIERTKLFVEFSHALSFPSSLCLYPPCIPHDTRNPSNAGPSVANRLLFVYRTLLVFSGIFTFLVSYCFTINAPCYTSRPPSKIRRVSPNSGRAGKLQVLVPEYVQC